MSPETPTARRLPAATAPTVAADGTSPVERVTAPFAGIVVPVVRVGEVVARGGVVATIEAIKLEAAVTSPVSGTVSQVAVGEHQQVEGGDLLVVVS
jgi:pyruvate carboxylase